MRVAFSGPHLGDPVKVPVIFVHIAPDTKTHDPPSYWPNYAVRRASRQVSPKHAKGAR